MQYHRIKRFEGAYTDWDSSDAERGSLRKAHGLAFGHLGAMSSLPPLIDRGDVWTAASAANVSLSSACLLSLRSGQTLLVAGFDPDLGITMLAPVSVAANEPSRSPSPLELLAVLATNLNPAKWYASRIGDRTVFGNGVDANRVWHDGAMRLLGQTPTSNVQSKAKEVIPPCTCFAVNSEGVLFASGNPASPKRVWVTDRPDLTTPGLVERVRSLQFSFVDIQQSSSTKVTALSSVRDYVLVHTDDRPVVLYGFGTDAEGGWRCRQTATEFASSAPNQNCVRDSSGDYSIFLGRDGEVYRDEATAPAAPNEAPARKTQILTDRGRGVWNRLMDLGASSRFSVVAIDGTDLVYVFAPILNMGEALYVLNTSALSYSGPFSVNGRSACELAGTVTFAEDSGDILSLVSSDLADADLPAPTPAELAATAPSQTELQPSDWWMGNVRVDTSSFHFIDRKPFVGRVTVPGAFTDPVASQDAGVLDSTPGWYRDARLGFIELPYQDFGDPAGIKDFLEVQLTFAPNSVAYLGVAVQTDMGTRRVWKGQVHGKENHKVFLNVKGRRLRLRVYLVTFARHPCVLRDVSVGWLPGVAL
jgi:hypothetical protein